MTSGRAPVLHPADVFMIMPVVMHVLYWNGILTGCWLLCWTLRAAEPVTPSPASADSFASQRLLDVRVQMAPEDWEKMRAEHVDLLAVLGPNRFEKPAPKPYKTYRADVVIDGVSVKAVGIHKRGFIGSSSFQRPSIGIKFDAFDSKLDFRGERKMSLNNNLQDLSQIHQVLAYQVFNKAGVAAPRCSLARVSLNGKALGIYSHVEPIEKEFLKKHFKRATGNLYEGLCSDFRIGWLRTFEKKNHKDDADRSDLEAVARALEGDDAGLLARLEPLIDLDQYLTYWAVETLIGHWDSYSNDGNNYLIYREPASGRFQFIPWGADSVFGDPDPFEPAKRPETLRVRSLLPCRLYQLPQMKERYRERLRQVLKTAWNETELLAEANRLAALVKSEVDISRFQFELAVEKVRTFIRNRRGVLEAELDGPAPTVEIPPRKAGCFEKVGTLAGDFSAEWLERRPLNPFNHGTANFTLELHGKKQNYREQSVIACPADAPRNTGCPGITILGVQANSVKLLLPIFILQPETFKAPARVQVDGFSVSGLLVEGAFLGFDFKITGFLIGTLELQAASTNPGGEVSGKMLLDIYQFP